MKSYCYMLLFSSNEKFAVLIIKLFYLYIYTFFIHLRKFIVSKVVVLGLAFSNFRTFFLATIYQVAIQVKMPSLWRFIRSFKLFVKCDFCSNYFLIIQLLKIVDVKYVPPVFKYNTTFFLITLGYLFP